MIAPLVMPMTSCEPNCAGSLTACTASNTSSTAMRTTARRELQLEDLTLSISARKLDFDASPVVMSVLLQGAGGRSESAPCLPHLYCRSETSRVRLSLNSPSSTSWIESFVRVVSPALSKLQVPSTPL